MLQTSLCRIRLTLLGTALFLLTSCGGDGVPDNPINRTYEHTGTLVSVLQVNPGSDAMSLQMKIKVKSFTPQSGGAVSTPAHPLDVLEEFSQFSGFSTVFDSGSMVPTGTYSQVTLAFSEPRLTVLDASTTPPQPVVIAPLLSASEITIPITPALQIREYNASAIIVSFDINKSLERDSQGRYTGKITPILSVSSDNGPGSTLPLDEVHGVVYSLNSGPWQLRGFNIGLDSSLFGGTHIVQVDDATKYVGVTRLEELKKGYFVDLRGAVSNQGSLYAGEVQAEALEDLMQNKAAFLGLITSVSPGSMTLFVREEAPVLAGLDSTATVVQARWVTGITPFGTAAAQNALELPFAEANLVPGQHVVVHGATQSGAPASVTASAIMLRRQTLMITGVYDVVAASDAKTGGFTAQLTEPGTGQSFPVTVITGASTSFVSVRDLNDMSAADQFAIKGLLYWEPIPGSLNGKSWAADSRVILAEQITRVAK